MTGENLDFDDVLTHAGEFGKYQWVLFFAQAPFCFILVFIYFNQFFISLEPDHWCEVPELLQANVSLESRRNLSIPVTVDAAGVQRWSSCQVYDVDYNKLLEDGVTSQDPTWPVRSCQAWEYDISTTGNYHTIVSELSWVCERKWYATLAQSVFFLGAIVGGVVCGWAADRYGRVPVLVFTNIIGAVSSILTAVSTSLGDFLLYRFLAGISFDNIFVMMYVLALEYVGSTHRTLVANLSIGLFFTAGTVLLPWLAIWVGDWRVLSAVSAAPMILACLSHWFLPESARWLLSQGRVDETVKILKRIAHVNGRTIPEDVIQELQRAEEQQQQEALEGGNDPTAEEAGGSASLLDLFRTPRLRRNTIAVSVLWMLLSLAFDGHARNVSNLQLNVFVTFTVASATELPADVFLILTLDRWGRRWCAFGTLLLSGFFTVLTTAFSGNTMAIAVLAMLGRLCVNVTYNIGLQYAAEVLPTVVRAQGVSAVHITGYVASLFSPVVVYMGTISPLLSLSVLGLASLVGAFVSLLLPETLNSELPQTLADGEDFGKDQSFFYFPCITRDSSSSSSTSQPTEEAPRRLSRRRSSERRPSLRGEVYKSSLVRNRKEVA